MALPPFLRTLTPSARIAYPHVLAGVRSGLSGNAIGQALVAQGLGIRRSTLQSLIRAIKGVERPQPRLRTLRRDFRPDPNQLPVALHDTRRNYSFTVRVEGIDSATGRPTVRHITIATNDLLSRGELEGMAEGIVNSNRENYPIDVTRTQLESGLRSPALAQ